MQHVCHRLAAASGDKKGFRTSPLTTHQGFCQTWAWGLEYLQRRQTHRRQNPPPHRRRADGDCPLQPVQRIPHLHLKKYRFQLLSHHRPRHAWWAAARIRRQQEKQKRKIQNVPGGSKKMSVVISAGNLEAQTDEAIQSAICGSIVGHGGTTQSADRHNGCLSL